MIVPKALDASRLRTVLEPNKIPWDSSDKIPIGASAMGIGISFQPRVKHSLDISLQIDATGYNIYLSGDTGLGRTNMLLAYLKPRAKKKAVPPDLIYVFNFKNHDKPLSFKIPAGQGNKLKNDLKEIINKIIEEAKKRYDTSSCLNRRSGLVADFQNERMSILRKMDSIAVQHGFNFDIDDNGALTLFPLLEGKRIGDDELEKLDTSTRLDIKKSGEDLSQNLMQYMYKLNKAEDVLHEKERTLELELISGILEIFFDPFVKRILRICSGTDINEYFLSLREDIIKNSWLFLQRESQNGIAPAEIHSQQATTLDNILSHYEINVLVDNSHQIGCPVIIEDNPTASNLLGCIERESELGTLVTDLTLIRAGSLHRANGGFLILHVDDLLQHPAAWDGLLRSLRSSKAIIEDSWENTDSFLRTRTLIPEAIDLDVKVILIGNEDIYETLLLDDRFSKLFLIKAHMTDSAERNKNNIRKYLLRIAEIISEMQLKIFDQTALACLVDLGSQLCEDQKRMSLKFPVLREIMIEANAIAASQRKDIVDSSLIKKAYDYREYRANLLENLFQEDYCRELIKVQTTGTSIGQVNGLSVTLQGDYEFGLPHRISCAVGVGQEGIIDLEREADLGGPIHTKAMLILKSYLTNFFAKEKPLVLSGALYFEQNYAEIEGDSASGAELVALLSALAEIPVRLDMAFTGAVNHCGEILAVGGVTKKIEGFFRICSKRGLTGSQGVIIPEDNIDHLMLSSEIISAVKKGVFVIYPVKRIEQAIKLLTGMDAGRRLKNGRYSTGSFYDHVDRRLENLGFDAHNAYQKKMRK